jgi:CRISP-associated protein Cas1
VRGLEGQAARHYFEALRLLLPVGTDFAARSRRPPRDPVYASLSMGYAVLANNLHPLVRLEGLNAHMGHLHVAAPCSLALVSDLMEEFRAPVVDSVVLHLWRQGACAIST